MTKTPAYDPLTDPNPPENFAGTPIYDSLHKIMTLKDEFFTLSEGKSPKNVQ